MSAEPKVETFFEPYTGSFTHLIHGGSGSACAIIDPVLDFNPLAVRVGTQHVEKMVDRVAQLELKVEWLLETHAHADRLSAATWLHKKLGGRIATGRKVIEVQRTFKAMLDLNESVATDGSQFHQLFDDGDNFAIGELVAKVLTVPGHTPSCVAYAIGSTLFVGDTLFLPDVGTARCDFPGGSAETLFDSIQRLLSFPDETVMYMCHDYPPNNRPQQETSTVGEQRRSNIHLINHADRTSFAKMRNDRDRSLEMPRLLWPSIQTNICAGALPAPNAHGQRFFKLPIHEID